MDKQLFDDAIGEVPPSTIDVDAVIVRGRRAARVRRVANPVVAAGVAVLALSAAVVFTMTRDDGEATRVGGQPPSQTKSVTVAPPVTSKPLKTPPEACSRPDLESSAEVIARLTPVARAAVADQQPALQVGALEFTHYFLDDENATNPPICHKRSGFDAKVTSNEPGGQSEFNITVQAAYFNPSGFCAEMSQSYCEEVTGPNGEVVVEAASEDETGVGKMVYVLRPDGTLVWLKVVGAPSATLPLDYDQLVAIGTDPGLTLFP